MIWKLIKFCFRSGTQGRKVVRVLAGSGAERQAVSGEFQEQAGS